MSDKPETISRTVLPIPDRPFTGPIMLEKRGRVYFSLKTKRQKSPNQALEWTAGSGRWLTATFLAAVTQLGR